VVQGNCFSCHEPEDDIPVIVKTVAQRIKAPFFSVDIARRRPEGDDGDADWRLIELGDGQVSDKKDWPLDRFVEVLAALK